MTEIRFYHLQGSTEDQVLPQLALKAWQAGGRVVVKAQEARVAKLNDLLWTFRADVFLPHGAAGDDMPERQPVWLTAGDDNPNGAKTLILASGCGEAALDGYDLCCTLLDGRDEARVAEARALWTQYKEAGHQVSYWQQAEGGGWQKKA